MDLGSLLPIGGASSNGVGNIGDGGSGKSSAVAKTTFGDRSSTVTTTKDTPKDQTPLYLVAALAAVALVVFALKD